MCRCGIFNISRKESEKMKRKYNIYMAKVGFSISFCLRYAIVNLLDLRCAVIKASEIHVNRAAR